MQQQKSVGDVKVSLPARKGAPCRKAKCEVSFAPLPYEPAYRRPAAQSSSLSPVQLYAIWIRETLSSKGVEPLEWMLLTDIPVLSLESALEKIDWYKSRWHIENYHKVLKSGCNVEKSKLNHADKLERFATLLSLMAVRVYQLKLMGREQIGSPCTEILEDEEWKVLYSYIHKTKDLPKHIPTTKEVMHWIARLGGFLGRKGDGHPGSIVIWRGWQRFTDILASWKTFQSIATSG